MMKRTKMMLATAAFAVVLPAGIAASQDGGSGQTPPRNPPGQSGSGQRQQTPAQQPGQQDQARPAGQQMSPEQSKQMAQKWFEHAASDNQFEIQAAQLAQERFGQPGAQPAGGAPKMEGAVDDTPQGAGQQAQQPNRQGQASGQAGGQHQQLLQSAQMIQRDHEQAQQALRQAAQQAGVQISQTPELTPVHQAKLEELQEKQGEEFARAWVFGNMAGHTHGILEYTWASTNAPNPQIKQYASQVLPKLQQHAQHLAPIAYGMAGMEQARTAGERMGGEQPGGQQPGGQQPGGQQPGGQQPGGAGGDRPAGGGSGGTAGGTGGAGGDRPAGGGTGGGSGGGGGGGGGM